MSGGAVTGHNILLDGVTVTGNNNRKAGTITGTNSSNSVVKLVGVSLNGGTSKSLDTVGVPANSGMIYGSDGYVIMADYSGVSAGDSKNTSNPSPRFMTVRAITLPHSLM